MKKKESKTINVALDPNQMFMRQETDKVKQTPIHDFKKLPRPSGRKKAGTKPKHLSDL